MKTKGKEFLYPPTTTCFSHFKSTDSVLPPPIDCKQIFSSSPFLCIIILFFSCICSELKGARRSLLPMTSHRMTIIRPVRAHYTQHIGRPFCFNRKNSMGLTWDVCARPCALSSRERSKKTLGFFRKKRRKKKAREGRFRVVNEFVDVERRAAHWAVSKLAN